MEVPSYYKFFKEVESKVIIMSEDEWGGGELIRKQGVKKYYESEDTRIVQYMIFRQ